MVQEGWADGAHNEAPDMDALFRSLFGDGSTAVSTEQFKRILGNSGTWPEEEVNDLIRAVDSQGNGVIALESLLAWTHSHGHNAANAEHWIGDEVSAVAADMVCPPDEEPLWWEAEARHARPVDVACDVLSKIISVTKEPGRAFDLSKILGVLQSCHAGSGSDSLAAAPHLDGSPPTPPAVAKVADGAPGDSLESKFVQLELELMKAKASATQCTREKAPEGVLEDELEEKTEQLAVATEALEIAEQCAQDAVHRVSILETQVEELQVWQANSNVAMGNVEEVLKEEREQLALRTAALARVEDRAKEAELRFIELQTQLDELKAGKANESEPSKLGFRDKCNLFQAASDAPGSRWMRSPAPCRPSDANDVAPREARDGHDGQYFQEQLSALRTELHAANTACAAYREASRVREQEARDGHDGQYFQEELSALRTELHAANTACEAYREASRVREQADRLATGGVCNSSNGLDVSTVSTAEPSRMDEEVSESSVYHEHFREEVSALKAELLAANTACAAYRECATRVVSEESDSSTACLQLKRQLEASSEALEYFKQLAAKAHLELVEHWCSSEQNSAEALEAVEEVENANDELEARIYHAELALSQQADCQERQLEAQFRAVEEHYTNRRCSLEALESSATKAVAQAIAVSRSCHGSGAPHQPRLAAPARTFSFSTRPPSPPPVSPLKRR